MLKSCLGAFCSRQVVKTIFAFLRAGMSCSKPLMYFIFSLRSISYLSFLFWSYNILYCRICQACRLPLRLPLAVAKSGAVQLVNTGCYLSRLPLSHLTPDPVYVRVSPLAGLQDGSGLKFGQAPPDVQGRGHCYFRLDPRSNLSFVIGRSLLTKRVRTRRDYTEGPEHVLITGFADQYFHYVLCLYSHSKRPCLKGLRISIPVFLTQYKGLTSLCQ